MRHLTILFTLVALTSFYSGKGQTKVANEKGYQDDKFKSGQIWKYETRDGEEASRLIILKVEQGKNEEVIVHISVINVKINNPQEEGGISDNLRHLPLSKEAVLNSVTELESADNDLPDYLDGYNRWKEAYDKRTAGFFTISVQEAVEFAEESMNQ